MKLKLLGSLIIVLVIAAGIAAVINQARAEQASVTTGTKNWAQLRTVATYMNEKAPKAPANAKRVGLVVWAQLKVEPWSSSEPDSWWGIVITKADGRLVQLDVHLERDARSVAERVKVGDYIAIFTEADEPGGARYSDAKQPVEMAVHEKNAVPNIPTDQG